MIKLNIAYLSNIKDKLTTWAAIAFGTCTVVLGLPAAVNAAVPNLLFVMPPIVNVICGIIIAASILVTQVLAGKNPNGTAKSDKQIVQQNKESELAK